MSPKLRVEMYYVYLYLREDRTPYYVGKGSGKRINQRHKFSGEKFLPLPPPERRVIVKHFNDEDECFLFEEWLIEFYGRKLDGGILVNISEGGEKGYAVMKGKKHTEESKNKMSNSHKGKNTWNKGKCGLQNHSDETKQKISNNSRGNKSRTGQKQSQEEKNKKSESLKKYYAERREQGYKR